MAALRRPCSSAPQPARLLISRRSVGAHAEAGGGGGAGGQVQQRLQLHAGRRQRRQQQVHAVLWEEGRKAGRLE